MQSPQRSKTKIAIIGATGLLGKELADHFGNDPRYTVIPLSRADIEIDNSASVCAVFENARPDIVINSAGMINIDKCEQNPAACIATNHEGAAHIISALSGMNHPPLLIHISSSEIFGEISNGDCPYIGYREDQIPRPITVYQKSKRAAEEEILRAASRSPDLLPHWYIVRASWLYGKGRPTFVELFLQALQQKKELAVIQNQWRSPTWTKHFAHALENLITGGYQNGIYHIANEVGPGEATSADVVQEIKRYLGPNFADAPVRFVHQNDFFTVPRAPSTLILNTKLPKLPHWRDALHEYLRARYL